MTNQEAIEILRLYKQRLDESCSNLLGNDKEAFELAIKALEERPKGKWIEQDNGFGEPVHICSKCGKRALEKLVWIDTVEEVQSDFCPNCGRRLKNE